MNQITEYIYISFNDPTIDLVLNKYRLLHKNRFSRERTLKDGCHAERQTLLNCKELNHSNSALNLEKKNYTFIMSFSELNFLHLFSS